MHLPCTCHALAMHLPCTCHALAMHLPRTCHALAMHLPCTCLVLTIGCGHSHALAMHLPCTHYRLWPLACTCHALTLHLPCTPHSGRSRRPRGAWCEDGRAGLLGGARAGGNELGRPRAGPAHDARCGIGARSPARHGCMTLRGSFVAPHTVHYGVEVAAVWLRACPELRFYSSLL
eukprot:scaffold50036_cov77-Phaeocystis_antarctica.AAC.3